MPLNLYQIRAFERRAATLARKAGDLAHDINGAFGIESDISGFADNVVCATEELADTLRRLPGILKAGGQA